MHLVFALLFLAILLGTGLTKSRWAHLDQSAFTIADCGGAEKSVWLLKNKRGGLATPDGTPLKRRRGNRLYTKSGEFFGLIVYEPEDDAA